MFLSNDDALAASAPEFIFRITVLASVSFLPYRIQSKIQDVVFLTGAFLGVIGIIIHLALMDCLLRNHHQDVAGGAIINTSAFSLRKNTFI